MQSKFKSEVELAEIIIQYLKGMGWEVYQEVQISSYGKIADIVAKQDNLIWILECKLSLSLSLIAQAKGWKNLAHYVSIVVPSKRDSKGSQIAKDILRHYGIGCYEIHDRHYNDEISLSNPVAPRLNRKAMVCHVKKYLTDKQKNWAKAGNANGLRYTPFQDTKHRLIQAVHNHPGLTIKELIESIDHHYASDKTARSSILQWINRGVIKELDLKMEGRTYKVYLRKNHE